MFAQGDHARITRDEPAQGEGDQQNAKEHRDDQDQSPYKKTHHGVGSASDPVYGTMGRCIGQRPISNTVKLTELYCFAFNCLAK
jgi:hypothetical protein